MNDKQQLVVELENALTRARKDVTEAANQKPNYPRQQFSICGKQRTQRGAHWNRLKKARS